MSSTATPLPCACPADVCVQGSDATVCGRLWGVAIVHAGDSLFQQTQGHGEKGGEHDEAEPPRDPCRTMRRSLLHNLARGESVELWE